MRGVAMNAGHLYSTAVGCCAVGHARVALKSSCVGGVLRRNYWLWAESSEEGDLSLFAATDHYDNRALGANQKRRRQIAADALRIGRKVHREAVAS